MNINICSCSIWRFPTLLTVWKNLLKYTLFYSSRTFGCLFCGRKLLVKSFQVYLVKCLTIEITTLT